jgi:hypothetical protein
MKPGVKQLTFTISTISGVLALLVGNLQAQQVPIPQTAAELGVSAQDVSPKALQQRLVERRGRRHLGPSSRERGCGEAGPFPRR